MRLFLATDNMCVNCIDQDIKALLWFKTFYSDIPELETNIISKDSVIGFYLLFFKVPVSKGVTDCK